MLSKRFNANDLVISFENLRMSDVEIVGGKNASLGEMISQLPAGLNVPNGFATTSFAFKLFLKNDNLAEKISQKLENLNVDNISELVKVGAEIRSMIENQKFPQELEEEIRKQFKILQNDNKLTSFAVRSSATAEDLPDASFAGQQETFLNVVGIENILQKIREVFASLYNDRAISYRVHKGFAHDNVALSAGIQRMVRSDLASSGVMFTIDTESGFEDVIFITSSFGLGECVVQGSVNPDEFYVHKPTLKKNKFSVIRRNLGSKLQKMIFADKSEKKLVKTIDVSEEEKNKFSLNDSEIEQLAKYALIIENHYKCPMDIEWGKDGSDGKFYILQARPETVKSQQKDKKELKFTLKGQGNLLVEGRAIGQKIGSGKVKIIQNIAEMDKVEIGDILVTDMTDPNWEPVMKRASAIVTNRGGRTCHAAIIARELGVPAVVGCGDATEKLKNIEKITVSCAEGDTGKIYEGIIQAETTEIKHEKLPEISTKIMMNVGNPQMAFEFAQLPNAGVGLARLEFIINNNIGIHPRAILDYPEINNDLKETVKKAISGYETPKDFYIKKLTEGISTIASSFYPKPVIVRMSDFKSNEYKKLIGGNIYEPEEENPMLGFRGVARYLSSDFHDAFKMECQALLNVRNKMDLDNVQIMIPFVRTLNQADKVIKLLAENGLIRGQNNLKIIMMCEIPSNVILAKEFLGYFDGFSIGSNDLTQLTLGLDRDSGLEILTSDFDERDLALKKSLKIIIEECLKQDKYIGICGQGPSDYPDFAKWLMEQGINSISLNPDTVIKTWQNLAN